MSPTEFGAVMRYADDLIEANIIQPTALVLLGRIAGRYRHGRSYADVSYDELAGDGMARCTAIAHVADLEAAHLIIKERRGVVVGGRWRQTRNRYWVRTVDQAKAAAIRAAEDAEFEAAEVVLFEVSLPPCESEIDTASLSPKQDSSLLDRELGGDLSTDIPTDLGITHGADTQRGCLLEGPAGGHSSQEGARGEGDIDPPPGAWRSEVVGMGGRVSGEYAGDHIPDKWAHRTERKAGGSSGWDYRACDGGSRYGPGG